MRFNSFLFLIFIVSICCLVYIFSLPNTSEEDWFGGISSTRFIITIFFGLVCVFTLILILKLSHQEPKYWNLLNKIKVLLYSEKNIRTLALLSLLIFIIGIFILSFAFLIQEVYIKAIFIRLFPFVLLGVILAGSCFLFCECMEGHSSSLQWIIHQIQYKNGLFIFLVVFSFLGAASSLYFYRLADKYYPSYLLFFMKDLKQLLFMSILICTFSFLGFFVIKFAPLIKNIQKIILIIFLIGCFLFLLNIIGALTKAFKANYANDLYKLTSENNQQYAYRLTEKIHQLMTQVSPNAKGEIILRVPITENYILSMMSLLSIGKNPNYELCNHKAALSRGYGLCSQKAVVAAGFLQDAGIKYRIIGLDGHVVVMAKVDPAAAVSWWILDPDYGVVIEHGIDEVEANPNLIVDPYKKKGYNDQTIESLKRLYDKQGNFQVNTIEKFLGAEKCKIEKYSYILAWIIPLLLVTPILIRYLYHKL